MTKPIFPPSVYMIQDYLDLILSKDKYAFSLPNNKQIRNMLENSATKHSTGIEHPQIHTTKKAKQILKQIKQEASQHNWKAWEYAKGYVETGKEINSNFISQVLKTIVPEQNLSPLTGLRSKHVMVSSHNPPEPNEVLSEITHMIYHLKTFETPLEKAIFSHYHLLRIHPGLDGNGRCSRIIQNAYLHEKNYLPIVIPENERKIYINSLKTTDKLYEQGNRKYLEDFSEYIVNRMRTSIRAYTLINNTPSLRDLENERLENLKITNKSNSIARTNNKSKDKTTYNNKKQR